jgi:hypothetical protein
MGGDEGGARGADLSSDLTVDIYSGGRSHRTGPGGALQEGLRGQTSKMQKRTGANGCRSKVAT